MPTGEGAMSISEQRKAVAGNRLRSNNRLDDIYFWHRHSALPLKRHFARHPHTSSGIPDCQKCPYSDGQQTQLTESVSLSLSLSDWLAGRKFRERVAHNGGQQ